MSYFHYCPRGVLTTDEQCAIRQEYLLIIPHLFFNHSDAIEIAPKTFIYAVVCNTPLAYHSASGTDYCTLVENCLHPNQLFVCFKLLNTSKYTTVILNRGSTLDQAFSCICLKFTPGFTNNRSHCK
jgi:hypothetical protein